MLSQKLCLVTGGGSGIGKVVCDTFARMGAIVVATDVNKSNLNTTKQGLQGCDGNHQTVHCDVTGAEFVDQLHDFVLEEYGRPVDILVNSAGITMDKKLHNMSEQSWDWVINTNLKGTFLMTQAFTRSMKEHKIPGNVINLSSIIGKVGNIGQANYAASKAGVMGFTKTVAKELGPHNIRCNCILPGFIQTPMTDKIPSEHVQNMILPHIPMQRMGQPEEVANFIAVLANNEFSSYITGACIEIAGGLYM